MRLTKNCCLIVATLVFALFGTSVSAQTCPSPVWHQGPGPIPGGGYWEYIANGQPINTDCWTLTGNVTLVTTSGCNYSPDNAFDMHYGARVIQEFTVPGDREETRWDLSYLLTMQDPHNDGWWNRLKVTVYNVDTGQKIASHTYWGDDPDITCTSRNLTFTGNFAGRRLRVIFSDGSAYSDTIFRVRSIHLVQY